MPIYFSWFITALLSVSVVRTITIYRRVGAFLYCVKIRTRVQNTLQAIALNHALRHGHALWSPAGAESTPGLGSVSLPQSKAGRTSASVRAVAEADQGARPAGGRRRQAATPGVAAAHPSRSGADHGIGHRCVPGRRAPVCHWQPGRELHRDDPV